MQYGMFFYKFGFNIMRYDLRDSCRSFHNSYYFSPFCEGEKAVACNTAADVLAASQVAPLIPGNIPSGLGGVGGEQGGPQRAVVLLYTARVNIL